MDNVWLWLYTIFMVSLWNELMIYDVIYIFIIIGNWLWVTPGQLLLLLGIYILLSREFYSGSAIVNNTYMQWDRFKIFEIDQR